MTQEESIRALRTLRTIIDGIAEAVRAGGPRGVPGGTLYAALMAHGCTYAQFELLMRTMVSAGKLVRKGQLYFAAEEEK